MTRCAGEPNIRQNRLQQKLKISRTNHHERRERTKMKHVLLSAKTIFLVKSIVPGCRQRIDI
jgi:hypothetical protein